MGHSHLESSNSVGRSPSTWTPRWSSHATSPWTWTPRGARGRRRKVPDVASGGVSEHNRVSHKQPLQHVRQLVYRMENGFVIVRQRPAFGMPAFPRRLSLREMQQAQVAQCSQAETEASTQQAREMQQPQAPHCSEVSTEASEKTLRRGSPSATTSR